MTTPITYWTDESLFEHEVLNGTFNKDEWVLKPVRMLSWADQVELGENTDHTGALKDVTFWRQYREYKIVMRPFKN